ncbi:MAG TPA: hypothetical protein VFI95_10415 [Terriglobales bacterium]|nr:hypothetical protein [Terriglobales bacterium]
MAEAEYRGLRMLLRVFAALLPVGSMFMIFSSKELLTRMFLMPPVAEVSTLLLFVVKELGGIMLMLGALMWLAARDPVRIVAVIDAFILGFCVLAVTPLVARAMLPIREIYPDLLVWGRSVVRLAIAGVLYWLRPRGAYVRGA